MSLGSKCVSSQGTGPWIEPSELPPGIRSASRDAETGALQQIVRGVVEAAADTVLKSLLRHQPSTKKQL
jgi:hypothetical protein